jgi:DMSO/TMAO reductase YedYZ molybdopterin-dependent catalytic subunit
MKVLACMSLFRSLQTEYEQDAEHPSKTLRSWPATYRDTVPAVNFSDFTFQIRIEGQLAKFINLKQLAALPSFTENRRITSKAGWTYYGQWKGIAFQTFMSLFSTPHLYPWVRLETLDDTQYMIERKNLMNYRVLLECDGEPLTPLYGGPLWMHCFDYYLEYSIPHLKSVVLTDGSYESTPPQAKNGFTMDKARIEPGRYYDIHHERITTL